MVHGLEAEYFGTVDFYFLDADDPATRDFQRQFGFYVQPEFYLLDGDGNLVKKWVGYVAEADFRETFGSLLGE